MRKTLIIMCLALLITSCKEKDEPTPPFTSPFADLEKTAYMMDLPNRIILYNGKASPILNGKVSLGKDVFEINSTDSELERGKAYEAKYKNFDFKLFLTELPILSVNTKNQAILDDPKVAGTVSLWENNTPVFESVIGIELRGGVSQYYPKKSYSLELWADEEGKEKRKEPLLGMREDDDWVLDGLWNEPIRIRDFTAHDLWADMGSVKNLPRKGKLSIDKRFCELFINDTYQGLYYLGEKFDRKQLDLKEFDGQMEGELYKGYTWADAVTYDAVKPFNNSWETWSGYEAKYPSDDGIRDWTNLYNHVDFVVNSTQEVFETEIASRVDMANMVNYYLFVNYLAGEDNRGKNVYTGKIDRTTSYFFLPWDLDGSFGNDWRGERVDWVSLLISNGLYDRLLQYPLFVDQLKQRWTELRTDILEKENVKQRFRNNYSYLEQNGVYSREALVEDLSRRYSKTEIDYLESWVDRRTDFLDTYIGNL